MCILGGISISIILLAFLLDDPVAKYLKMPTSPVLHRIASWVAHSGEGWVLALLGGLGAVFFWLRHRFETAKLVFLIGSVALLTGATATLTRSLVGRTRPNANVPQGIYGVRRDSHWIIGQYQFGSFPSGHAATVAGFAAAVWLTRRKWALPTVFYAGLVCWSRLSQGCHHFSDIVAAAVLGSFCAPLYLRILSPPVQYLSGKLQALTRNTKRASQEPEPAKPLAIDEV